MKPTRVSRWKIQALLRALCLSISGLFVSAPCFGEWTTPQVVVEIAPAAESLIDARATRRLLKLELLDVRVPPALGQGGVDAQATLFFRVLGEGTNTLLIELWEKGQFYGARRVSGALGSAQVRARMVALAAAGLVRRLQHLRETEVRLQREAEEQRLAAEAAAARARPRWVLNAGARSAWVGTGDFWLVGPNLGTRLRTGSPFGVEFGSSLMFGELRAASSNPALEWLELSAAPEYRLSLSPSLGLDLGVRAAAALVHVADVSRLDDSLGQTRTWSARAVGELRGRWSFAPETALQFGVEAGFVLRDLNVQDQTGQQLRPGGLWLGASLGIALGS